MGRLEDEASQKDQLQKTKRELENERRQLDRTVETLQKEVNCPSGQRVWDFWVRLEPLHFNCQPPKFLRRRDTLHTKTAGNQILREAASSGFQIRVNQSHCRNAWKSLTDTCKT